MATHCSNCSNRSSCFNELTINELGRVSQNKTEIIYKKGETIIKQDSFASHIYFIKSGLAKVYLEKKSHKNLILEIVGKGSILGITSLNHKKIYNFSVVALEDIRVCEINIDIINSIMKNNISFSSNIMQQLNTTIDQLLRKVISLAYKNTHARIAELLIMLMDEVYKEQAFTLNLSRKELAESANVATENMVRILKSFESDQIIKLNGKKVEILDYNRLLKLSES